MENVFILVIRITSFNCLRGDTTDSLKLEPDNKDMLSGSENLALSHEINIHIEEDIQYTSGQFSDNLRSPRFTVERIFPSLLSSPFTMRFPLRIRIWALHHGLSRWLYLSTKRVRKWIYDPLVSALWPSAYRTKKKRSIQCYWIIAESNLTGWSFASVIFTRY